MSATRSPLRQTSLEMAEKLREVVSGYEAPDFEIYLAGGDIVSQALTKALIRDSSIFLTLGAALMGGILFLLFRRASGVLLPVATVLLTLDRDLWDHGSGRHPHLDVGPDACRFSCWWWASPSCDPRRFDRLPAARRRHAGKPRTPSPPRWGTRGWPS